MTHITLLGTFTGPEGMTYVFECRKCRGTFRWPHREHAPSASRGTPPGGDQEDG